jgi:glutamyl-tRNA synthetase
MYRKHAHELVEGGHAYPCFCTAQRLAALKLTSPRYDRHCMTLHPTVPQRLQAIEEAKRTGKPFVIRMKMPGVFTRRHLLVCMC